MTPTDLGNPPPTSWRTGKETANFGSARQDDPGMPRRGHVRPRLVEFAPFLIETNPKEYGWEPIGLDDPIVQQIIHDHGVEPYPAATELGKTRVSRNEDGSILAERCTDSNLTHADLAGNWRSVGSASRRRTSGSTPVVPAHRPCSDGATTSHAIGQFACPVVSGKTHREVSPTAGISTSIPTHSGS